MPDVLLVTGRPEELAAFADRLGAAQHVTLTVVRNAAEAIAAVRAGAPRLAVIDSRLPDMAPLALVRELLQTDATVNTAVVSALPDAEFHEASEGLGVMAQLPDPPGPENVPGLLERLQGILHPG